MASFDFGEDIFHHATSVLTSLYAGLKIFHFNQRNGIQT